MARSRIHRAFPTPFVVGGLAVAFLGERAFGGDDTLRVAFAGVAAALVGVAVAVRLQEWLSATADNKPVARALLLGTGGVALALALYALVPLAFTEDTPAHARTRGVLWALWPTVLVVSGAPLVALELAVAPSAYIETYEHARIRKVTQRTLALALLVTALFLGNYLANRHDARWELSAGHQTVASDATARTVRDLTKPVEIVLFYPRANEVSERLQRYFAPLVAANDAMSLRVVDQALAGDVAKDAKITENGYVGVFSGGASDKVRVGTDPRSARSALRRFDTNLLKSLVKVTSRSRVAYFTAGHGERARGVPDKEDKRPTIKEIARLLETWQFTVRDWSVADGSGARVPDDADILFVMGPERPFLEAEIEVLKEATDRGVRLFIALEPALDDEPTQGLLTALGLEFDGRVLAHEQKYAQVTRTKADRTHIFSTKFSSHPSVTTLSRNARRGAAVVFDRAGSLRPEESGALPRVKTEMTIHAFEGTFADLDGDLEHDAGEPKDEFELAAAVTRTSTTGKADDEARIVVVADVDVLNDELTRLSPGNAFLFRDTVQWLARDVEAVAPPILEEEDVRIVHKKEEDAFVFYGTTFGLPLLVLGAGWLQSRRRRR